MRISDVADWTLCERYALESPKTRSRPHVAAMVGQMTHRLLVDETQGDVENWNAVLNPQDPVVFDAVTPTYNHAAWQAHDMVKAARDELKRDGWTILETEQAIEHDGVTGRWDIKAWNQNHRVTALLDLKTGHSIGAGWLQVGGYLAIGGSDCAFGGIVHAPRSRQGPYTATIETRDANVLIEQWEQRRERVAEIENGGLPLASPGPHCRRCRVQLCGARAE